MSQSMMALNLSIFPPASIKIIILFKFWNNINSLYHIMQHLLSLGVNLNQIFCYNFFFSNTLSFFISNQGQTSAFKVACVFLVLGAQLCLIVAQQFVQVIYVCEEYSNFQDLKSIFMISDFKIFQIMLLRQLHFGVLSV